MSPRVASPPSRLIHDGWILTKVEAVTDDSDLAGLAGQLAEGGQDGVEEVEGDEAHEERGVLQPPP